MHGEKFDKLASSEFLAEMPLAHGCGHVKCIMYQRSSVSLHCYSDTSSEVLDHLIYSRSNCHCSRFLQFGGHLDPLEKGP